MNTKTPNIGVGVIIIKRGKVLLGQRTGSHGADSWGLPGGHLEFGETVEQCAAREVEEETGLKVSEFTSAPYSNDFFTPEDKHYVTLFIIAAAFEGEPKVMEADKCLGWQWCEWSDLPKPLFQPLQTLFDTGFVPESSNMYL